MDVSHLLPHTLLPVLVRATAEASEGKFGRC